MARVDFPYGKKRAWELDTADADIGLKSIPDSLVLKHSLHQSRDQLLNHTFQRFTSKARGAKAPEPPPPHTIMSRGRCDLVIGPHHFRQTTFYEVHYMQPATAVPPHQSPMTSLPSHSTGTTQQQSSPPAPSTAPVPTTTNSGPPDDEDPSQLRLTLGGGLEYTISPDLVARIHHEASVNPIFAAKFRLAVEPNATPEQIRNFAFALPHLPGVKVTGAPSSLTLSTEQQVRLPPIREWDLVIEFQETPTERWLIPRGTLASCSRLVSRDSSGVSEVNLTLRLPIRETQYNSNNSEETNPSDNSHSDSELPRPVKFTLCRTPNPLYDMILRWIGGDDKNRENAAALAKIPKRQKVFLPQRISQGALLTQLQAAQMSGYTMKPLKQGPSNPPRPRRKPQQKPKPAPQGIPIQPGLLPDADGGSSTPPVQSQKPVKIPKEPKEPKRRRFQPATKPTLVIRCTVCFKTDVPLMKGGRFCRECVDAGKANDDIPQLPQKMSFPSYTSTPYGFTSSTPVVMTPTIPSTAPPVTEVGPRPAAPSAIPLVSPTSQSSTPSQDTPTGIPPINENTTDAHISSV